MHPIFEAFNEALMITSFVFVMIMLVDYVNVLSSGRIDGLIRKGRFKQYLVSSFLGVLPGCLGSFMAVSLYVRGTLSFGAITGALIAASGDEAFVMLALFPGKALLLFCSLFIIALLSSYLMDALIRFLKIQPSEKCKFEEIHREDNPFNYINPDRIMANFRKLSLSRFLFILLFAFVLFLAIAGVTDLNEWNWERITFVALISVALFIILTVPEHYLNEHIWEHIAKKHLWRIFLWSVSTLVVIDLLLHGLDIKTLISNNMVAVLLLACVVGLIPQSGPHLVFVMMFSKGLMPFSVLLANSIVQEGHAMLPFLSHSVKDCLEIKAFKFILGFTLGFILYLIGL